MFQNTYFTYFITVHISLKAHSGNIRQILWKISDNAYGIPQTNRKFLVFLQWTIEKDV